MKILLHLLKHLLKKFQSINNIFLLIFARKSKWRIKETKNEDPYSCFFFHTYSLARYYSINHSKFVFSQTIIWFTIESHSTQFPSSYSQKIQEAVPRGIEGRFSRDFFFFFCQDSLFWKRIELSIVSCRKHLCRRSIVRHADDWGRSISHYTSTGWLWSPL